MIETSSWSGLSLFPDRNEWKKKRRWNQLASPTVHTREPRSSPEETIGFSDASPY